jgi:hypothetical protein
MHIAEGFLPITHCAFWTAVSLPSAWDSVRQLRRPELRARRLLLDEPTAGLDHRGAEALLTALDERSASGMAIVFATHNSDLALRWANRAMVLEEGHPLAEGAPADILQDESLCLHAGIRQPTVFEIGKRLRHRFGAGSAGNSPASPSQLADWLAAALAIREGAPQ